MEENKRGMDLISCSISGNTLLSWYSDLHLTFHHCLNFTSIIIGFLATKSAYMCEWMQKDDKDFTSASFCVLAFPGWPYQSLNIYK